MRLNHNIKEKPETIINSKFSTNKIIRDELQKIN